MFALLFFSRYESGDTGKNLFPIIEQLLYCTPLLSTMLLQNSLE